jgi:hypothetical protein
VLTGNSGIDRLPSAANAPFNSYNKQHAPTCLPNTRVDLLHEIYNWADGQDKRRIFWLNGLAGTGKSTIARTIARRYFDQKRLGASFFFSRGGGDVSHAGKFFTSLASQLARNIPQIQRFISDAIIEQSDIANQSLHDQWRQLVFRPLSRLDGSSPLSYVLIVDALDECDNEDHIRMILQLLAEARLLQVRLRVLITSRPEVPIRYGFCQITNAEHRDFILHDIKAAIVDHDIFIFLYHEMGSIGREWALGTGWPGEQALRRLVLNASGLFIWAATACRFIRQGRQYAARRLSMILDCGTSASEVEQHLNKIYMTVLRNSVHKEYLEEERQDVYSLLKQVLGTIVALYSPLSICSLSELLHLPTRDIKEGLADLHAILDIPQDTHRPLRLHHPSFRDFLTNQERCCDSDSLSLFWVDENEIHLEIARRCIQLMSSPGKLKQNICNLPNPGILRRDVNDQTIADSLPKEVQYACHYWVDHLEHGNGRIRDGGDVHIFLQRFFLYWVEAISLCGLMSESVDMIRKLQSILEVSFSLAVY